MLLDRPLFALGAVLVFACSRPDPPPSDPTQNPDDGGALPAPTLEVRAFMYTPIEEPIALLADGDAFELWAATQGGHVITAGAQVKGLAAGDFIEITGQLRDPDTDLLVTESVRTVVMAEATNEPGWAETDRRSRSQMAHLALCPRYEDKAIDGNPYELTLRVRKLYANDENGSATLSIVPTCQQTDPTELEHCQCECEGGYYLGKCG